MNRPIALKLNPVAYLIKGGDLLKQFFGYRDQENRYSQVWLASTVVSTLGMGTEGLSQTVDSCVLKELLAKEPERYLGAEHAERYGSSPAVLVKLLNSVDRLLVQVHPSAKQAEQYFHSRFGKTEAWYVLETDQERPAYIYAGFRPGVKREDFRHLIEVQDTEGILSCLHRFEIRTGDMIFIPTGLPHALGGGSLVLEIQEPVDITLRAERIRSDGSVLPEESLHSGIGVEAMLDCFDFSGDGRAQTWQRIAVAAEPVRQSDSGEEICLIGRSTTGRFGIHRIMVRSGQIYQKEQAGFAVLLVVSGTGVLQVGNEGWSLKKGSEYFLPYGIGEYSYRAEERLELLECYPPECGLC